MRRGWRRIATRLALLAALLAVAACGSGGGGASKRDVEFTVSIEGVSEARAIEYTLVNDSAKTIVAYNRVGHLPDAADPEKEPGEFITDVDNVYVTEAGGQVEIAKKIDHYCHENPDADDCHGAEPVRWRIGGTIVEPGEELSERIEIPPRGESGAIDTRGASVRFCLGIAAITEENPASPDGLYRPTRPQTVICGDPATFPVE